MGRLRPPGQTFGRGFDSHALTQQGPQPDRIVHDLTRDGDRTTRGGQHRRVERARTRAPHIAVRGFPRPGGRWHPTAVGAGGRRRSPWSEAGCRSAPWYVIGDGPAEALPIRVRGIDTPHLGIPVRGREAAYLRASDSSVELHDLFGEPHAA